MGFYCWELLADSIVSTCPAEVVKKKLNTSLLLLLIQESVARFIPVNSSMYLQSSLCIWTTVFLYASELFEVIKGFFHFFQLRLWKAGELCLIFLLYVNEIFIWHWLWGSQFIHTSSTPVQYIHEIATSVMASSSFSSKPLKYCTKTGHNVFQQLCTADSLISAHELPIFMLSGFHHEADEKCAYLGYYAVSSGYFLQTFRDILSTPSSRLDPSRWDQ